ncbi:MAG: LPXTG cell wall anchor domain-containing protein, partial [Desulfobacteraceae bacterium]
MFKKKVKTDHDGLFKGVIVAHSILLLHLLMIAGLGFTIVFLTGLAHYMSWIVLGGLTILGIFTYLFYRRIRKEGKSVGEALQTPLFQGREVEI